MANNITYWENLIRDVPPSYVKWFEGEKKFFSKHVRKNSSVVEIGCGDGRSLMDLLPLTHNLVGVDHDKKAVSDAKIKFRDYPEVNIIQARADNLPFENESFDYVTCIGTFSNFSDSKYKVLEEMKRILKEKGEIIISCYNEDALKDRLREYERLGVPIKRVDNSGKVFFGFNALDNTSEQFSEQDLEKIFNKVGLKLKDIIKSGVGYICSAVKV